MVSDSLAPTTNTEGNTPAFLPKAVTTVDGEDPSQLEHLVSPTVGTSAPPPVGLTAPPTLDLPTMLTEIPQSSNGDLHTYKVSTTNPQSPSVDMDVAINSTLLDSEVAQAQLHLRSQFQPNIQLLSDSTKEREPPTKPQAEEQQRHNEMVHTNDSAATACTVPTVAAVTGEGEDGREKVQAPVQVPLTTAGRTDVGKQQHVQFEETRKTSRPAEYRYNLLEISAYKFKSNSKW